ncbi:MAG TPA: transglycosylase family protein [Candidatus Saccharimonadales bacterium]|nr:transglycosylase family protein [Candidatus Saccharimonadales bacterium]
MQHVALAAALFAGALFLAPQTNSFAASSVNDAANIQTIINNKRADRIDSLAAAQAQATPAQAAARPVTVTVKPGDYLNRIAQENGTNYQRLYYANTEVQNPDLIYPGQQLRVPAAEEQLAERTLPDNTPAQVRAEVEAETQDTPQQSAYSAPTPRAAQPTPAASAAPSVPGGSVWDSLAQCEAGGNWAINTGNGFYGGLQFTLSSWQAAGGTGYPHQASREEQILRGTILQGMQGWGAWPACSAKLGLR